MLKIICAFSIAISSTAANATTVTYNVNQMIGLGGVEGTIQTDGTIGALTQSNVLGFDLLVGGPGAAVELTNANSVIVTNGSNLSATASDLFFNYSGPSGFLLFQLGSFGTGMHYYCNSSTAGTCFQGASAIPASFDSPSAQVEIRAGNQSIASTMNAVPELDTWAMLILGFGVMGCMLRARRPLTKLAAYSSL
uniref:hypothetical protein n=1 Tax=uncultured Sphingomonas sp. TaxID=158754 RepID=UPI0035CB16E5